MAEKKETSGNEKAKETKKTSTTAKSTTKKIATGSTKKVVQKRSSSTAGKTTTKKEEKQTKTTKTPTKAAEKSSKSETTKKSSTTKKAETPKKDSSKNAEGTKKVEKNKKEQSTKTNTSKSKTTKKPTNKTSKETTKKEKSVDEEKLIEEKVVEEETAKKEEKSISAKSATEIEEAVAKEMKENKKVSKSALDKIHTRVFQNICMAVVVMFYLNFIILGFMNIETKIFITDLKVFSIALLVVSIGVFEYAYKKDSGRFAIHGIEILIIAFMTMALIYVNLMLGDKFVYIVALLTYILAIYYVAKSIVIYNKMKREYFVDEMKKMIKK